MVNLRSRSYGIRCLERNNTMFLFARLIYRSRALQQTYKGNRRQNKIRYRPAHRRMVLRIEPSNQRKKYRSKTISRSISKTKMLKRSPYARAVLSLQRSLNLNRPVKSAKRWSCANPCINNVIRRWSTFWINRHKQTNALLYRMIASSVHLRELPAQIRTLYRLAKYTRAVE